MSRLTSSALVESVEFRSGGSIPGRACGLGGGSDGLVRKLVQVPRQSGLSVIHVKRDEDLGGRLRTGVNFTWPGVITKHPACRGKDDGSEPL